MNSEGEYQPCHFISQSLDATQQRYDIYDRELLAVYRALTTWRQYLIHSEFPVTIWTDHENLTRFREVRKLSPRQVRWQIILSLYDLKFIHKPGSQMKGSDALSR